MDSVRLGAEAGREETALDVGKSGRVALESVRPPRPLPVLVLADVSGSMAEHGKIESLNLALATMIQALARERSPRGEITVGVITFGGAGVTLHQRPTPASTVTWADMEALGGPEGTPMGLAFEHVQRVLEDESLCQLAPTMRRWC